MYKVTKEEGEKLARKEELCAFYFLDRRIDENRINNRDSKVI